MYVSENVCWTYVLPTVLIVCFILAIKNRPVRFCVFVQNAYCMMSAMPALLLKSYGGTHGSDTSTTEEINAEVTVDIWCFEGEETGRQKSVAGYHTKSELLNRKV